MVHSLVPMAVNIKVKNFEEPARLINCMELTAAIGMAYRQAKKPMPEIEAGTQLREFRDEAVKELGENSGVDEKLMTVISNYIFKFGETIGEDAVMTLKLGYEF